MNELKIKIKRLGKVNKNLKPHNIYRSRLIVYVMCGNKNIASTIIDEPINELGKTLEFYREKFSLSFGSHNIIFE